MSADRTGQDEWTQEPELASQGERVYVTGALLSSLRLSGESLQRSEEGLEARAACCATEDFDWASTGITEMDLLGIHEEIVAATVESQATNWEGSSCWDVVLWGAREAIAVGRRDAGTSRSTVEADTDGSSRPPQPSRLDAESPLACSRSSLSAGLEWLCPSSA